MNTGRGAPGCPPGAADTHAWSPGRTRESELPMGRGLSREGSHAGVGHLRALVYDCARVHGMCIFFFYPLTYFSPLIFLMASRMDSGSGIVTSTDFIFS